MTGLRTASLDVPTMVVNVTAVEPPGPKWVDLEVAHALKDHNLGDFEDSYGLVIPKLRQLWPDLSQLTPDAAEAFLAQKAEDEADKAKEKIDILGESLNAGLTIILATLVEALLMTYLLAHLIQIRRNVAGNEDVISASPFFGVLCSRLGRMVMVGTLFIIPVGVCTFVVVSVFPHLQIDSRAGGWLVESLARWALIAAVGVIGLLQVREIDETLAALARQPARRP